MILTSCKYFPLHFPQDGGSTVTLKSFTGISIGGKIDGASKVNLSAKCGQIVIHDTVDGVGTVVYHYGVERVDVLNGLRNQPNLIFLGKNWEADESAEAKSS